MIHLREFEGLCPACLVTETAGGLVRRLLLWLLGCAVTLGVPARRFTRKKVVDVVEQPMESVLISSRFIMVS